MFKLTFNNKKTEYLNLIRILIMVRDYGVKLDVSEAFELSKYELDLIIYLQNLNNNKNLINLDVKTKTIMSYNNIDFKRCSDKEIYFKELNLINEIKKFLKNIPQ